MVYYCVAYGCKNRWTPGKKENISFHQFPTKKPGLCKKWVLALKRRDFVASNRSVICSDHFESTCFIQSGWSSKKG
ncbi:hypothetical protein B566_EDAN006637 [Ephemera danica]|nr:hypothetical protein B566_EDAN006637 [Ephemera danica]